MSGHNIHFYGKASQNLRKSVNIYTSKSIAQECEHLYSHSIPSNLLNFLLRKISLNDITSVLVCKNKPHNKISILTQSHPTSSVHSFPFACTANQTWKSFIISMTKLASKISYGKHSFKTGP
jgi:hypothetical protein